MSETLNLIAGHKWYVRFNHDHSRLEFIPLQTTDGYMFTEKELRTLGEMGYSIPVPPKEGLNEEV
jgi:hypothetical protein